MSREERQLVLIRHALWRFTSGHSSEQATLDVVEHLARHMLDDGSLERAEERMAADLAEWQRSRGGHA